MNKPAFKEYLGFISRNYSWKEYWAINKNIKMCLHCTGHAGSPLSVILKTIDMNSIEATCGFADRNNFTFTNQVRGNNAANKAVAARVKWSSNSA